MRTFKTHCMHETNTVNVNILLPSLHSHHILISHPELLFQKFSVARKIIKNLNMKTNVLSERIKTVKLREGRFNCLSNPITCTHLTFPEKLTHGPTIWI